MAAAEAGPAPKDDDDDDDDDDPLALGPGGRVAVDVALPLAAVRGKPGSAVLVFSLERGGGAAARSLGLAVGVTAAPSLADATADAAYGGTAPRDGWWSRLGHGEEARLVPGGDEWLAVREGGADIDARVWDAGAAMCALVWSHPGVRDGLEGRAVVDVGSGTGALGAALALTRCPSAVAVTDVARAVARMGETLALNGLGRGSSPPVLALAMMWGDEADVDGVVAAVASLRSPAAAGRCSAPPLLVLADVVYDPEGYEPLLATLLHGAWRPRPGAPAAPLALLAYRHRRPEAVGFFDAARAAGLSFRLIAGDDRLGLDASGEAGGGGGGGAAGDAALGVFWVDRG